MVWYSRQECQCWSRGIAGGLSLRLAHKWSSITGVRARTLGTGVWWWELEGILMASISL